MHEVPHTRRPEGAAKGWLRTRPAGPTVHALRLRDPSSSFQALSHNAHIAGPDFRRFAPRAESPRLKQVSRTPPVRHPAARQLPSTKTTVTPRHAQLVQNRRYAPAPDPNAPPAAAAPGDHSRALRGACFQLSRMEASGPARR